MNGQPRTLPPRAARAQANQKIALLGEKRPVDDLDAVDNDDATETLPAKPRLVRQARASKRAGATIPAKPAGQSPALPRLDAAPVLDVGGGFHDPGDFPDPIPRQVQLTGSPLYQTDKRLGKGGFGTVYLGKRDPRHRSSKGVAEVALKFEHKTSKGCSYGPPHEWALYRKLGSVHGLPQVYWKGEQGNWYILVMERLGPSLWDVWNSTGQSMSEQQVATVAMEGIACLKALHDKGYVHGDVKPENFLLGAPGGARERRLYLVDLGLAARWSEEKSSSHVAYGQNLEEFRGTIRYASVHAHLGRTSSRRDDLESLAYSLLFLLKGRLPWQGYQGDHKSYFVARKKMELTAEALCKGQHAAFLQFTERVLAMKFDDAPDYVALSGLFQPLLVRVERPFVELEGVNKIITPPGSKRARLEAASGSSTAPLKKTRLGMGASQWVTVFDKRPLMKQRYHYHVNNTRLLQHVEKGWQDGLFISAAASCGDHWTVVMDASCAYSVQIFKICTDSFLPKAWIMEKWEAGFYITAVAGSDNGSSLVVMSKGTGFTQQSYKVSDMFPAEWVRRKWREGMAITAMATSGSQWAVVMTRSSTFGKQVVELDFQYPSEGIHKRWDDGYRITAAAATPDQAAFVLSTGKYGRDLYGDSTQETLRTGRFPTDAIKGKWDKELYLGCIAFGRTIA